MRIYSRIQDLLDTEEGEVEIRIILRFSRRAIKFNLLSAFWRRAECEVAETKFSGFNLTFSIEDYEKLTGETFLVLL
jgi:hypothetical protein